MMARQRTATISPTAQPPWADLALGGLLILLTLLAYMPALRCGYVWDDDWYVTRNTTVQTPGGLARIWLDWKANAQYYPLVFTSFWLQWHLGSGAFGFHLVNVLLHAGSAVLLWRVLAHLRVPGAWLAAAVFALHPINVESVAWITERKNVLSCFFALASLLAWLHWANLDAPSRGRRSLYVASLLLFAAAMLSKTVACALPAAIVILLWWQLPRLTWRSVVPVLPMFAIGIPLGLFTAWVEKHHVGATGPDWAFSPLDRCLIAGRAVCFYAGKLLVPLQLSFVYPRWQIDAQVAWQYLFPAAVLGLLIALWLLRHRIGKGPLAATLIFVGALFPALGFVNVYPMRFSFVADHFAYLAGIAFLTLVVTAGVIILSARLPRQWQLVVTAGLLVTLGAKTWHECGKFADLKTLWQDTLRKNAAAWLAHNNLGSIYKTEGNFDAAIPHLQEGIRLKAGNYDARFNLGTIYMLQGRLDDALAQMRTGLTYKPDSPEAWLVLAKVLAERHETAEAEAYYMKVLASPPVNPIARYQYALMLMQLGRGAEAAGQLRTALGAGRIPQVQRALAWILATHPDAGVRNGPEAVRLAEESCGRNLRDGRCPDVVAAAWAEVSRFDEAARLLQSAIAALPPDSPLRADWQARCELYQRGQPYREPTLAK